jgi:hypothetical protein
LPRIENELRSTHGSDAHLAQVWAVWQQRHLNAVRRGIQAIEVQTGLRAGLSLDEAVDIFDALAGTDVYRALVRERGWTPDHYELWLFRTGCLVLLGIVPAA